jgi:hypothetical protein
LDLDPDFAHLFFKMHKKVAEKTPFHKVHVLRQHMPEQEAIMFTLRNYPLHDKIDVLKEKGYRLLGNAWLCDKYGLEPIDQIKCNVIAHPKKTGLYTQLTKALYLSTGH